MSPTRIVSADDHIDLRWMPPDAFNARVPEHLRDRVPNVHEKDGKRVWVVDGRIVSPWSVEPGDHGDTDPMGRLTAFGRAGMRLEPGELRPTTPELRLADMDLDGIDASVLYGPLFPVPIADPEVRNAYYHAYNEWVAEFAAQEPSRLVASGLIPTETAEEAVEEIRHIASLGVSSGMFKAAQVEVPLWHPQWEPMWEAAADTGVVLAWHIGGGFLSQWKGTGFEDDPANRGTYIACAGAQMDEPLASLILSGALERFPELRVVLAESGIGWIPSLLERLDDAFSRFEATPEYWDQRGGLRLSMRPSEYFRRQCGATFASDEVGLRLLDFIGEDNVMFASDYPHGDGSFPNSRSMVDKNLGHLTEELQQKLLCDNATRIFKIPSAA